MTADKRNRGPAVQIDFDETPRRSDGYATEGGGVESPLRRIYMADPTDAGEDDDGPAYDAPRLR